MTTSFYSVMNFQVKAYADAEDAEFQLGADLEERGGILLHMLFSRHLGLLGPISLVLVVAITVAVRNHYCATFFRFFSTTDFWQLCSKRGHSKTFHLIANTSHPFPRVVGEKLGCTLWVDTPLSNLHTYAFLGVSLPGFCLVPR